MKILLAIKPKYIEKIINKEKIYEFRKVIPSKDIDKVYVYASYPISKIVGEFTVKKILTGDKNDIWWWCQQYAGITKQQFYDYFSTKNIANAIEICKYTYYNNYIGVEKLNLTAPQNFCYINSIHEAIIEKESKMFHK